MKYTYFGFREAENIKLNEIEEQKSEERDFGKINKLTNGTTGQIKYGQWIM